MDYARLVKLYGSEGGKSPNTRYSPAKLTGIHPEPVNGSPKADTFERYVERQNLTMRMSCGAWHCEPTPSREWKTLPPAVSLHFFRYNFCRVHKTLGSDSRRRRWYH